MLKAIRAHGWHWSFDFAQDATCAAKANHRLDAFQLAQWWQHLGHQPIERVTLRSTKGSRTREASTRYRVDRLRRYPNPVIAVFSKRTRRGTAPAYFLCSDTTLSVRCLLKYYSFRWQAEVDNFFLKERFGLADYRVQSFAAIAHWHALVFAAYAFIQYQRVKPLLDNPKTTLPPLGDTLADYQRWHGRQMILYIVRLVRQGKSNAELLAELMP